MRAYDVLGFERGTRAELFAGLVDMVLDLHTTEGMKRALRMNRDDRQQFALTMVRKLAPLTRLYENSPWLAETNYRATVAELSYEVRLGNKARARRLAVALDDRLDQLREFGYDLPPGLVVAHDIAVRAVFGWKYWNTWDAASRNAWFAWAQPYAAEVL